MINKAECKPMPFSSIPVAMLFTAAMMLALMTMPAQAKNYTVSEILDNNGFQILLFALDATELTSEVDRGRLVLFAPTDDVFEATAEALGCTDVMELAGNLLNTPVGDTNALAYVLAYHVYPGRIKTAVDLLNAGDLEMASGDNVTTGVGANGQYVMGIVNETPSNLTTEGLRARKGAYIYGIDQILLPIDPTGICS